MAKQSRTLVGDAEGRRRDAGGGMAGEHAAETAVLDRGGLWIEGAWYWRVDLEAQQRAEREVRSRAHAPKTRRDGGPLPSLAHYRPTERWVPHPRGHEPYFAGAVARLWAWVPPMEGSAG